MKEFTIKNNEANQRFDKYLKKLLPNATGGFIYKMLRKKNITLNGSKATGNEMLNINDSVKLFLSDDTFDKFSVDESSLKNKFDELKNLNMNRVKIIYSDEDILIASKPANMLSQKASDNDISVNEILLGYLIRNNELTFSDYKTYKPSVCNRLDRNTTGLILMGKTLKGSQYLSEILKSRDVRKYYHAVCKGSITKEDHIKGYLTKDEKTNKVSITDKPITEESLYVETAYKPVKNIDDLTLLEIHLITGRSHQIRAHLASIGHPIIGDIKYGDANVNRQYKSKYQELHSVRIELPDGRIFEDEENGLYLKLINQ